MIINNPNQRKVFLITITILLSVNIVLLTFLLLNKDRAKQGAKSDRKTVISNFLKKEIGFDQEQLLQYDTTSKLYRVKIKSFFENFGTNKNEQLKKLVSGNFSDSVIQSLGDESAAAHKIMEVNMFTHIKNIRQLCKPAQLPAFDSACSAAGYFFEVLVAPGGLSSQPRIRRYSCSCSTCGFPDKAPSATWR